MQGVQATWASAGLLVWALRWNGVLWGYTVCGLCCCVVANPPCGTGAQTSANLGTAFAVIMLHKHGGSCPPWPRPSLAPCCVKHTQRVSHVSCPAPAHANASVPIAAPVYVARGLQTFVVGEVDEASKKLIKTSHDCLAKAIAMCKPGVRFRDVGDVITKHAQANGWVLVQLCHHQASPS